MNEQRSNIERGNDGRLVEGKEAPRHEGEDSFPGLVADGKGGGGEVRTGEPAKEPEVQKNPGTQNSG